VIVADDASDRDTVEFRQAREEPPSIPKQLEQRRHFDALVGVLSLKFINLPANEIDPENGV